MSRAEPAVTRGIDWPALRAAATEAMRRAYAPYSRFPVGAAGLIDDGRVVLGCNVENASYGLTLCAECGLVSALYASGGGRLLAVSCVDGTGSHLMPCGRCRQLLWEVGGPDCLVDAAPRPLRMTELLPNPFDDSDLAQVPSTVDTRSAVPAKLAKYVGRGTVFVHAELLDGRQLWTGYWERASGSGREPTGIIEEAPTWPDLPAAVAWARARTPRVVVVEPDGTMKWAGAGDPPPEVGQAWDKP
jgi:cytidine deaminase